MIVDFYRTGRSFLHGFDPRAKLVLLVPLFACFFFRVPPVVLVPYCCALMALVALTLGPRELLSPLKAIGPVVVLICLLTPPFHRTGAVVWQISGIVLITADGARETALMVLRFLGITFGFFAVVRTVSPEDLVLSLRWFRLPYGACLVVLIALRTIPSLVGTWHNVQDAHRLRSAGRELTRRRRLSFGAYMPLLTSVLIEAVKQIPVQAMALESRGYGRRGRRTSFAVLASGPRALRDACIAVGIAAILLAPGFICW
jgi:energy-coupling factor transport system permease protein